MKDPNRCGMIMDEKEILSDCLAGQKHMTSAYNSFAGECVNPQLRTAFLNILGEEHQIQAGIFDTMSAKGWYSVEQAEQTKIQQTETKFRTQG